MLAMDLTAFSRVKRKLFPERFLVLISRTLPQREMPAAGWRTLFLLLLLLLPVCCCGEEECVLGLVGRPVSLSCFLPQLLTSVNLSIAWRRGRRWCCGRCGGRMERWRSGASAGLHPGGRLALRELLPAAAQRVGLGEQHPLQPGGNLRGEQQLRAVQRLSADCSQFQRPPAAEGGV
ncbi:hypothetical protein F7725_027377 [Dissostichus mawsoni]|uniref:Uncharacterized protein n=1 Tax=Dissostichus mawsoni TaxID=36200 RepID=A0A7J5XCT8_DISMA|nr:hypothetical protein F7725_027377 [Dissostichus mawsoni]